MNLKLAVFDLDGTLIDSLGDIAASLNFALAKLNRAALPPEQVAKYVGDGARTLVERSLGPDAAPADLDRAFHYFLDYYHAHPVEHTTVYPGIREALDGLGRAASLAVLTNKPQDIAVSILEILGLQSKFIRIAGGGSNAKKPDPEGLRDLMQIADAGPSDSVMIGDSAVDVATARNAGTRSCGVLWGFQPESLEASRPDVLCREVPELLEAIRLL